MEFSVVLCVFLVLSAAPLERLKLGRIVPLLAAATFLLLPSIFGLLPGFSAEPRLGRLQVASGVLIVLVAVLEIRLLATLIASWRAASREGTLTKESSARRSGVDHG